VIKRLLTTLAVIAAVMLALASSAVAAPAPTIQKDPFLCAGYTCFDNFVQWSGFFENPGNDGPWDVSSTDEWHLRDFFYINYYKQDQLQFRKDCNLWLVAFKRDQNGDWVKDLSRGGGDGVIWHSQNGSGSGSPPCTLRFTTDGNLVIFLQGGAGSNLWEADPSGGSAADSRLILHDELIFIAKDDYQGHWPCCEWYRGNG
jgi:hypothetical protein